jgi:hypothetical protein
MTQREILVDRGGSCDRSSEVPNLRTKIVTIGGAQRNIRRRTPASSWYTFHPKRRAFTL